MDKQRFLLLIAGITCLCYGIITREYLKVMRKAITICLECIGIG